MKPIRLGTRASALAMAQSGHVAAALTRSTGRAVELVRITTFGDTSRASLTSIGGTGVFVTALRDALVERRVDVAVHSLKDLPTAPAPGLHIAAVPVRVDPRDAVVGARLAGLPAGSRVGTGSPRRAAQLRRAFPHLEIVAVRGNVDTRIGFVRDGELRAVVLATAGLTRLDRLDEVAEILDPDTMLPAPGQGALAVECRADDEDTSRAVGGLDDPASRAAVTAERALLAALEAGCSAPVGALASVHEPGFWAPEVTLRALVISPDGQQVLTRSGSAPAADAHGLGLRMAQELLGLGAAALMHQPAVLSADLVVARTRPTAKEPTR